MHLLLQYYQFFCEIIGHEMTPIIQNDIGLSSDNVLQVQYNV